MAGPRNRAGLPSRAAKVAPDRGLPLADLRGAGRLAVDLTVLVTDVVETMHANIARRPGPLGRATHGPARGITGFVYRTVRGVTRLVGNATDAALAPLASVVSGRVDWPGRDPVVGALNGVLGDHLEATANPLAIPMELRAEGSPLDLERASLAAQFGAPQSRIVVMVHGLCMTDAQWMRGRHDHGRQLARGLDATALHLRYNSGRHISTNGDELAVLLDRLVAAWPVPVRDLVLVGHSMGGLVIRSACLAAQAAGHRWIGSLRSIVFLGTPHAGAPLERGGHGIDQLFAASPYTVAFSRLGRLRSAGITDLRHGSVHAEDWHGKDRFGRSAERPPWRPLPRSVDVLAIAGSLSAQAPADPRMPRGDGLVPVASALSVAEHDAAVTSWIAYGTGHFELLESRAVFERMRRWLRASRPAAKPGA
jgi:hypothetical protein